LNEAKSIGRVEDWRGIFYQTRFQPPPPQTVREVFPHTAFRQPSSCDFQDFFVAFQRTYPLVVKHSLRWSSRDLSCGVVGCDPVTSCTVTYLPARRVEAEALPY
jgi:hypothetical protein